MTKRPLVSFKHLCSFVFAVETDNRADPVYFALTAKSLTDHDQRRGGGFQNLFGRPRSYSFHLQIDDRIRKAMYYENLRHKFASALPADTNIFEMSSFLPNVNNSVVKGFFVDSIPDSPTPETDQLLGELIHNNLLTVCTYAFDEEHRQWYLQLLSPTEDGKATVAEKYSVVSVDSPKYHPSTLNIINSSVFYCFEEAYKVLTECSEIIAESEKVLQHVDQRFQGEREGSFPVVVVEGLDATGKTTLTQSLKECLGGVLLHSPPECLAPWRACFDSQPPLIRRAFYALGNYITAGQIAKESARGPVIVDRYWHSTAAYAIATAVSGKVANLPGAGSEVYRWPGDLLRPDLVLLLTLSPEERLRRLRGRGQEKTREEAELEASHLFRNKVEEAYRRMENPACVAVDASPSADEVLQQVLFEIRSKSHL